MPSPDDWGVGNQRDAENWQYTVPRGNKNASRKRQSTPSGDDDDEEGSMRDLFNEDTWNNYDNVVPFDLSRVRPDEDEELLQAQPDEGLPSSLTLEKLLLEQNTYKFCQKMLARQ